MRPTKRVVESLSFAAICWAQRAESPTETELVVAVGTPWIVAKRPPAVVSLHLETVLGEPAMLSHDWVALTLGHLDNHEGRGDHEGHGDHGYLEGHEGHECHEDRERHADHGSSPSEPLKDERTASWVKPRGPGSPERRKETRLAVGGTPLATAGWEKSNDAVVGEETLTEVPGVEPHMDYAHNSLSQQRQLRWGTQWMNEVCRCVAAAATGYEVYCTV